MGEVAVIVEESMEVEEESNQEEKGVVGWESFLPRMFLRVLLVEGDDSTRHIIAALLRKCSYRVAAVADGLKAWETLKEKSHSIDLILTEVDLPSISGFGLLTMIMEHDICKNIPVIMMSSHDSISTVFKCMLRGAADFLVKPIRKNELRNMWQHVWRRKTLNGVQQVGQDRNLAQQKIDATSENNAASNHSSDYVACMQKNKECSEKGSDVQSSCMKPDIEAESAYVHNMQEPLQPKCSSGSLATNTQEKTCEENDKLHGPSLMDENEDGDKSMKLSPQGTPHELAMDSAEIILEEKSACADVMSGDEDAVSPNYKDDANIIHETDGHSNRLVEPSREAIDLIGAIDKKPQCRYQLKNQTAIEGYVSKDAENILNAMDGMWKLSSLPLLELSLRRSQPVGCDNPEIQDKHILNHSNSSAFSMYSNRIVQPPFQSATCFTEPQKFTSISHKTLPDQGHVNACDPAWIGMPHKNNQDDTNSQAVSPSGPDRMVFPCSRLGLFSVPVPVRNISFDGLSAGYGPLVRPIFCTQSGLPLWSTNSTSQQEAIHLNSSNQCNPETHNSEQNHHSRDQSGDKSIIQDVHKLQNEESKDDRRHFSSTTGHSGSNSLCNGITSQLNSSGCGSACDGSNGNATAAAVTGATPESGNDEGILSHDRVRVIDYQRSSHREAALTKFRLKRKDRCYEKKVRYQSRKKLAEQRPRVKGQFVRQVQCSSPSVETDHYYSDSLAA